jgi:signal transduction histidine kinase
MLPSRAFRRRIRIGFAIVVILAMISAVVSFLMLRSVIEAKDTVLSEYAHELIKVRELEVASEHTVSSSRAYLLTGDTQFLKKARVAERRFTDAQRSLRASYRSTEDASLLDEVARAHAAHQAAMEQAISEERRRGDPRVIVEVFEEAVLPKRKVLLESLDALVREKEDLLNRALGTSRREAVRATSIVSVVGCGVAILAIGLFLLSARTLKRLEGAETALQDLNRHLESRVAERTGELKKSVEELAGLAYAIAHNLRAPMRAMAGFTDIVIQEAGPRLDTTGRENLARVQNAACRMDDLVQGLLRLTRLSYTPYPLSVVDGARVVAVALANQALQEKRAEVEVQAPLPAFIGNETLFNIVLDELLSNALKFMAPGVSPRVVIRGDLRDGRARIRVQDNGIGIPPEYQERIFGVFERLGKAEDFPGLGIGLAIARKAVERMNGTIGVSACSGGGSEFWFELKAAT